MRLACFAGLLLGTLVLACSDSETMVALNVCTLASVDAEAVDSLEVRIEGAATATRDLKDVSVLPCGSKPAFFSRIRLADNTKKGRATVEVDAQDSSGALLETGMTSVIVQPEEVVVAFIELGTNEMPGAGGTGGTGGAAGAGGQGGDAGDGGAAN
jgi:hypothetical protein